MSKAPSNYYFTFKEKKLGSLSTCLPVLSDYYSLSTNVKTTSTQNPEVRNATFVQNTNHRQPRQKITFFADLPGGHAGLVHVPADQGRQVTRLQLHQLFLREPEGHCGF